MTFAPSPPRPWSIRWSWNMIISARFTESKWEEALGTASWRAEYGASTEAEEEVDEDADENKVEEGSAAWVLAA